MPYCSRCGVEVDDYTDFCPLCEAPIQRLDENGAGRAGMGVSPSSPSIPGTTGSIRKTEVSDFALGG